MGLNPSNCKEKWSSAVLEIVWRALFGFYHSLHRKYPGDDSFIFRPSFFAGPVSPAR